MVSDSQADQDTPFQPILPFRDVNALATIVCTVLALRSFAGTLDFVRATLDVGLFRQKLSWRRVGIQAYQTTTAHMETAQAECRL